MKIRRKVSISEGNTKMGTVPSISLSPGPSPRGSCKPSIPCFSQCYAVRTSHRLPAVKRAWDRNLRFYKRDPLDFFKRIGGYLAYHQPPYFRWHVAGDIPDQEYLNYMIRLALENKKTAFMCFTKQFEFDFDYSEIESEFEPVSNLKIIFSRWPGDTVPPAINDFSMAWMQDGSETRIPSNALQCVGKCDSCFRCWSLARNRHVYFNLH